MAAAVALGAVLLVGLAAGIVTVAARNGDETDNPAIVDAAPRAPAGTTTTTGAPPSTTEKTVWSEGDALARLQEIANDDAAVVGGGVMDRWVPQVSSKKLGIALSDGTVWDGSSILDDHQTWRARFPGARLLWSGDYSTFEAPDFWVTIVAVPFDTPAEALGWCDGQRLAVEDCYAKLISHTHPREGSTAHRRARSRR